MAGKLSWGCDGFLTGNKASTSHNTIAKLLHIDLPQHNITYIRFLSFKNAGLCTGSMVHCVFQISKITQLVHFFAHLS